jgi:glucose/arabinose dehydrogenase
MDRVASALTTVASLALLALAGGCGDDAPASTGTPGATSGGTGGDGSFGLAFQDLTVEGDFGLVSEMKFIPGTSELLALSWGGSVVHYRLEGDTAKRLGSFQVPGVYAVLDCGLISLAFDPDFAENHFLYVGTCVSGTHSGVFRLTFDAADYDAIPASTAEILVLGHASAKNPWHNVGSIGFDDEGALWALFGDKTVSATAQDRTDNLGALIRIFPNREVGGSGYTAVPSNPFAGSTTDSPDIWAYGLRSPWHGIRDSKGRYWIGDVGADTIEEINLVTQAGQNLGWATSEGPCDKGLDCVGLVEPLLHWTRADDHPYIADDPDAEATGLRVAWAGIEHRPHPNDPYGGNLDGKVLFGDFCVGFVRAATADDSGKLVQTVPLGHLELASGWDQGPDGYLYATTFGTCSTAKIAEHGPYPSRLVRALPASR